MLDVKPNSLAVATNTGMGRSRLAACAVTRGARYEPTPRGATAASEWAICQKIAQRANREEGISGKFWESRLQSVKILDETGLLACAAYVDLNPIRAALVEMLQESDLNSVRSASRCSHTPRQSAVALGLRTMTQMERYAVAPVARDALPDRGQRPRFPSQKLEARE